MSAPQIIIIVLYALGTGVSMSRHGQDTKYNFWNSLIATALVFALLIWGGFFE